MLQIVGWLLCLYLVVKGFELFAMKSLWSYIGGSIAFLAAPVFFVMINGQSHARSPSFESDDSYASVGGTPVDLNSESNASVDAASQALANAEASIAAAKAAPDQASIAR